MESTDLFFLFVHESRVPGYADSPGDEVRAEVKSDQAAGHFGFAQFVVNFNPTVIIDLSLHMFSSKFSFHFYSNGWRMFQILRRLFELKMVFRKKKNYRFDISDTCTKQLEDKIKLHFWVYMPFKCYKWTPKPNMYTLRTYL